MSPAEGRDVEISKMERMAVAGWCGILSRDSSNLPSLHFSLHFPSFSNDDDLRHMVMIIPKQNSV